MNSLTAPEIILPMGTGHKVDTRISLPTAAATAPAATSFNQASSSTLPLSSHSPVISLGMGVQSPSQPAPVAAPLTEPAPMASSSTVPSIIGHTMALAPACSSAKLSSHLAHLSPPPGAT